MAGASSSYLSSKLATAPYISRFALRYFRPGCIRIKNQTNGAPAGVLYRHLSNSAPAWARPRPYQIKEVTFCSSLRCSEKQKTDSNTGVFIANYLDTEADDEIQDEKRTALFVHGAPGSHKDFMPVFRRLDKHNTKGIALNFPGFDFASTINPRHINEFDDSVESRADYIDNFTKSIPSPRYLWRRCRHGVCITSCHHILFIDDPTGHSLGCPPVLRWWMRYPDSPSTAILINPTCHRLHHTLKPKTFHQLAFLLFSKSYVTQIAFSPLLDCIKNSKGFNSSTRAQFIRSVGLALNMNFPEIAKDAEAVQTANKSLILVYTDNDPLIRLSLTKEFEQKMGLTKTLYQSIDDVTRAHELEGLPKSFSVELVGGAHYPFNKYPNYLSSLIGLVSSKGNPS